MWPVNMTGKANIWPVKPPIRLDIVCWPAIISSPAMYDVYDLTYWLILFLLVDDELPDYIMVMLANKRSQEQMTEDLVLFLGANTALFTDW